MSTLTVSIVALVVFVVGAVVMFNLWQARGSRQRDRDREEDRDEDQARHARSVRAHQPQAAFNRRGSATGGESHTGGGGNRRMGADPGAWARERREPTLLSDDEARAAESMPREAFAAAQGAGLSRGAGVLPGVGSPPGRGLPPRADFPPRTRFPPGEGSHHGDGPYDGQASRGSRTAYTRDPSEREREAPPPAEAADRFAGHADIGEPERMTGEDLGPPEFEAPRLDPISPEAAGREGREGREGQSMPTGADPTPHVVPTLADNVPDDASGSTGAEREAPRSAQADVDHAVILVPGTPVNAERLIALTSSLRHVGSKAVRIEIAGARGEWLPLQSGVMVSRLRCSVLLANRQGPLNAVELSDFSDAMESLARRIGADFVARDMNPVLRRARDLDAVAARLDTQVDLGVEASAPITPQKLASVARKLGLADKGGRFACFTASGDLLFTLMPGATSDMLTLVLDVPRTAEEHDPWRSMVACASSCAKLTSGRVVDSAGRGMSVALIDSVGLQIGKRYRELAEAGLEAGSAAALRVFN